MPRHRWENNITKELQGIEWGVGMDCVDLAQNRDRWWPL
jgi:hypothetical protein